MNHDNVRLEAKKLMARDRGSHGWDHVVRVWQLCSRLGREEEADLDILEPAAFLHDIGRSREKSADRTPCHAVVGSKMARRILSHHEYADAVIEQILHCIATHRFRSNGPAPESLEGKVLFDADKLDAIGAVGIGRAFLFAGELGARLHNPEVDIYSTQAYSSEDTAYREYCVKLRKIQDRMLTASGQRMARERHEFMVAYFDRLTSEVQGKK